MKRRINSLSMIIVAATILTAFPSIIFALTTDPSTTSVVKEFENVKELLSDNVAQYDGREIQVSGEVEKIDAHAFPSPIQGKTTTQEEKIGGSAFILEGGGVFNDKIVVLMPKNSIAVTTGSDVTVTGIVRTADIIQVEREYGLDLKPKAKIELEEVETFLIAQNIVQNEDGED